MDLRRLRPGEWLLAAAAIVLVVALLLPWYAVGGLTSTGWKAFSVVDVVLTLCAIVAFVAVVLQATQRSPAIPVIASVAASWAGVVATVLVVVKLLDPPLEGSVDVRYGAWMGLAAAVGVLLGGWWAMRDERPGLVRSTHLESSG